MIIGLSSDHLYLICSAIWQSSTPFSACRLSII